MHHLSPKIQSVDTLGSSLTSPSQGTGVVRGHQGAICPEASSDYKDSPLQDQGGTDHGANCVPYNVIGSREICLYQWFRHKNRLLSKHSRQMSPCCLLVLVLLMLLHSAPYIYLPVCHLFFTKQTRSFFHSVSICNSGELLHPV